MQGTGNGTYPPDGATWLTYDGTNPWTNPGGDFDSGCSVVGVKGPVLIRTRTTVFQLGHHRVAQNFDKPAELQNYGAMLRIDETPVPTTGMPRAPFTSSYDPSYTPAYWPSLQVTIPPTVFNVVISGGAISLASAI